MSPLCNRIITNWERRSAKPDPLSGRLWRHKPIVNLRLMSPAMAAQFWHSLPGGEADSEAVPLRWAFFPKGPNPDFSHLHHINFVAEYESDEEEQEESDDDSVIIFTETPPDADCMAAFPTEEVIQYTSDEVSYASSYSFPQTPFQLDYSFWPNVRHYLKSSFSKPRVSDPMCTLCRQRMHIPHLSPYLNKGGSNVADPNLQAVVLPCGHIYHSDCFDKLDHSYEERSRYTMCPT
ncbi:hypothetical protein N656DRAFT_771107 [Canariomyces notabilis]|uniref:RING-type domain-containing protein n=1 Tax=Canariomyces notabilis TaxID=2074819 RepID=A0AAN6T9X0_9PEZI|nr:hypothetical protein N656DRAFT_771107 [Canariomyces arenarius]